LSAGLIRLLCRELKERGNPTVRVILPQSHEIRSVCDVVISRDIDIRYGFSERVTEAFPGLDSCSGGDGPLALMARISKSTKS